MFTLTVSIEYLAMVAIGGLGHHPRLRARRRLRDRPAPRSSRTCSRGSSDVIPVDDVAAFTSQLRLALFGALIMLFMVIEPEGLHRIWRAVKNYFRHWPFSY